MDNSENELIAIRDRLSDIIRKQASELRQSLDTGPKLYWRIKDLQRMTTAHVAISDLLRDLERNDFP